MSIVELRGWHREAVLESVHVVLKVTPGDLERATPCGAWTLNQLLRHMIVQHRGFAAAARGEITTLADWDPSTINGDLVLGYLESSAEVIRAFADESIETRRMLLPEISATVPLSSRRAMGFHLVDYVVHAWDVARAIGIDYVPTAAVAEAALQVALSVPNGPERTEPGSAFAPAIEAASAIEESPIDRIVTLLGRSPTWRPLS